MRIILLSMLVACATVAADPRPQPVPPTPPGPPTGKPTMACKMATPKDTRPVVFELAKSTSGALAASTKVYADGAWIYVEQPEGKGKQSAGCLDAAQRATIATTAKVPWTVTTAQIRCMAVSATTTAISVAGKPVFTEKLCSGQSLDAASQKALEAAHALLDPFASYEMHDGKH